MMPEWKLRIQMIYLNSKRFMKNTPGDWQKVYDALHQVYEEFNHNDLVLEAVLKAYCDLEDYWGGKENVCRG